MNRLHTTSLLLGAALLSAGTLRAQDFSSQNWSVGSQPSDSAAADFNGDGIMDLATTVDAPNRVQFLLGDGAGGFVLGGSWFLPAGSSPGALQAADLDGDGDADLAVALKNNAAVQIGLNDGFGNFMNGATLGVGIEPRGLDSGDLDGDGDIDLAVANRSSNSASVMTNDGLGGFTVMTMAAGGDPRGAALGDFDGDGDLDLAVTNHDDRSISIYTNTAGSFAMTASLSTGSQLRPEGITADDLDGDGDDDLAAAASGNVLEVVIVYTQTTAGSGFTSWNSGVSNTSQLSSGDYDCDGDIDIVAVGQSSNHVSVLPNLGGASFGAGALFPVGSSPENADEADLDGDGDLDIFVPNRSTGDVSILTNNCAGGPPAFALTVSGTCPGSMAFSVDGATPGGRVALIHASGTGLVTIPSGFPCAGTVLDLDGSATLGVTLTADAAGFASTTASVPASFCGSTWVQALDLASCATSNVVGF